MALARGIRRPSHFGSKEKLFAAIIHHACKGFAVDLFPQVADEPDIGVALRRIASSIENFLLGEGPIKVYRIIVSEGPRGKLFIPNPTLAADQLVALVKGPRLFNLPTRPDDPTPAEVVDGAVQMILNVYRPR